MTVSQTLMGIVVLSLLAGCSQSSFTQSPWDEVQRATPQEIATLHQPEALRADIDTIIALHERTCPNPYLRVSKDTILHLSERLKASINRPMTRREFIPIVMQMQAGYKSDHYGQGVPSEDLDAAIACGERLLPFRAEPRDNKLVVFAVAKSERAIEPGDTIVRIGAVSAEAHLDRLRSLVPNETPRYRDVRIRELYRTLAWVDGITLPTEVEYIRADGSRRTVTIDGVGYGARQTERTAVVGTESNKPIAPQGELLVDSPPFKCVLLAGHSSESPPIGLIDFPRMDGWLGDQWEAFLDQSMEALTARGATGLIVDIRKNGGGSTDLGAALLARLTDSAYRMNAHLIWRKSPESDNLFRMMTKPFWRWLMFLLPVFLPDYTALEYGEDLTYHSEAQRYKRVEPGFRGPTCLLIGDLTFSSATDLADAVRTYDLMLTIGQPTGGVPNTLGDIGPFQLPASRIAISFSQKLFIRASGDETDLGPVMPHIEVFPVVGRDSALERAIIEIRGRAGR
jgi:hypothetical protein